MSSPEFEEYPVPAELGLVPGYRVRLVPRFLDASVNAWRDWVLLGPRGQPLVVNASGWVQVRLRGPPVQTSRRSSRRLALASIPWHSAGETVMRAILSGEVQVNLREACPAPFGSHGDTQDETLANLEWAVTTVPFRRPPKKGPMRKPREERRVVAQGPPVPNWVLAEYPNPFEPVVQRPAGLKPGTMGYRSSEPLRPEDYTGWRNVWDPDKEREERRRLAAQQQPPPQPELVQPPPQPELVQPPPQPELVQPPPEAPQPEPPVPPVPPVFRRPNGRPRTRPFGPRRAPGRPRTRPPPEPLPPVVSPEKPHQEPYWLPG